MLSFEECKEILNSEEKKYTDEEVKIVMNVIHLLVKADIELINKIKNDKRKEGNYLFPRKHNGAS